MDSAESLSEETTGLTPMGLTPTGLLDDGTGQS